jgi:hypothetical protein
MARRGGGTAGRALALVGLKLLLFCCLKPRSHASSDSSDGSSSSRISIPHLDVAHAGSSWWQQDPTAASPAAPRHTQHHKQHLPGQPCDQTLSFFSFSRTQQQQHSFVHRAAGGSFLAQLSVRGVDTTPRVTSSSSSGSGSSTKTPQAADALRWETPQQQHQHQQSQHHQQRQQRSVPAAAAAAARRLLWGRRLLQLDLKLLQGASREQEVQKDILRLQQIQVCDGVLFLFLLKG